MDSILEGEMKPLPFKMDAAIRSALIGQIRRYWKHKSDDYLRKCLKTYIKTYRELKKAREIYLK